MPTDLEARIEKNIFETNPGLTLSEIAALAGCHLATVSKHFKNLGLPSRPRGRRRLQPPDIDRYQREFESREKSLTQISGELRRRGINIGKEALRRRFRHISLSGTAGKDASG